VNSGNGNYGGGMGKTAIRSDTSRPSHLGRFGESEEKEENRSRGENQLRGKARVSDALKRAKIKGRVRIWSLNLRNGK